MDRKTWTLKCCLATTAHELKINFGEFRSACGIDDFLIDVSGSDWSPTEVAARSLDTLCICAKGRMDFAVCVAIVKFLDETMGAPKQDPTMERRLKDLTNILAEPGTLEKYRRWATTWYG